jgi:hypothetical protein
VAGHRRCARREPAGGIPALRTTHRSIIGRSGAYEAHGEPEVSRAADVTVTDTRLPMEADDYTARISYRDDRTIAGLFVLPGDAS